MDVYRGFTTSSEKAAEVTSELFVGANNTSSLNLSNITMDLVDDYFIYSPYAKGISGVFAWSAVFVTCFQVSTIVLE